MPEKEKNVIGKNILAAYGRQGLAELRAALPLADSPIAQPTDYGMLGVATPGEVAESRRDDVDHIDDHSAVGSRINQVMGDTRGRDDPDIGMERD
jgi:hypothetical protein